MLYKVHHKVDNILHPILILNPTNLILNEVKVAGDMLGPDGQPVGINKIGIKFPNGVQIVVEETLEVLEKMFNGDADAPTSIETS